MSEDPHDKLDLTLMPGGSREEQMRVAKRAVCPHAAPDSGARQQHSGAAESQHNAIRAESQVSEPPGPRWEAGEPLSYGRGSVTRGGAMERLAAH